MSEASALFTPFERAPAYKRLCQEIEAKIMTGDLKPGDRLPTETALAQAFALNRSTVREGIRLLEQSGLVERIAGRRLAVARPSRQELGTRLTQAMVLHDVTFRELWQTVAALEPAAAAYAATARTKRDLVALRENLEESQACAGDALRLSELDVAFHALVAEASHNRALLMARDAFGRLFYPAFAGVVSRLESAAPRLLTAHRAIADAIEARDAEEARRWMERHIADFRRGYGKAGLDPEAPVVRMMEKDRE